MLIIDDDLHTILISPILLLILNIYIFLIFIDERHIKTQHPTIRSLNFTLKMYS